MLPVVCVVQLGLICIGHGLLYIMPPLCTKVPSCLEVPYPPSPRRYLRALIGVVLLSFNGICIATFRFFACSPITNGVSGKMLLIPYEFETQILQLLSCFSDSICFCSDFLTSSSAMRVSRVSELATILCHAAGSRPGLPSGSAGHAGPS